MSSAGRGHEGSVGGRAPISQTCDEIARRVIGAAIEVHTRLGPGLLESVYEACLCHELHKRGIGFERQVSIPIVYDGLRLDMIVEGEVIVELKSVDALTPLHTAQLLTYLKLTGKRLGLLLNFNVPRLKVGIKRVVL